MACGTFNLRTDFLTGANAGGTWAVTAGVYGGAPLTGDDPSVNIGTDITLGASVTFTYSGLDPCTNTVLSVDVTLYNMLLGSASNNSDTLCDSAGSVNIFNELSGTLGADGVIVWSGDVSNPGFSGSGTSALFSPSTAGTGSYSFTATINADTPSGYTDLGCCDPIVAVYSVTVSQSFDPGSGGSFAGC